MSVERRYIAGPAADVPSDAAFGAPSRRRRGRMFRALGDNALVIAWPLRPPEHAGGTGGHRDAPLAISDGQRATVNLLHRLHQLQRNSDLRRELLGVGFGHQTKRTREAYALLVRE